MDLTQVTLKQFIGAHNTASPPAFTERDVCVPPGTGSQWTQIKRHDEYTIVLLHPDGDVAVVDEKGDEAGFYVSNSLAVHDEHRGRGLATAMVLYAYKYRSDLPTNRSLSEGGKSALTSAWEVANGHRLSPWWP